MDDGRQICLVVEYDGQAYHGWQRQANALTIQEVMEEAVRAITGETVPLVGAGRTDAGVHALGQVASFRTRSAIPAGHFARALNAVLPRDIRVLHSSETASDFHPQYGARGKSYLYVILNRPTASALLQHRAWHIPVPLERAAMREAARCLVGRHDFSSFRSSSCTARHPVRELTEVELEERGALVELRFTGNGFLKNMVRNMVGTLAAVGRGAMAPARVAEILAARDRALAGPCAPARGLYLLRVYYG